MSSDLGCSAGLTELSSNLGCSAGLTELSSDLGCSVGLTELSSDLGCSVGLTELLSDLGSSSVLLLETLFMFIIVEFLSLFLLISDLLIAKSLFVLDASE